MISKFDEKGTVMMKVLAIVACMFVLQGCIHKVVTVPVKVAYKTTAEIRWNFSSLTAKELVNQVIGVVIRLVISIYVIGMDGHSDFCSKNFKIFAATACSAKRRLEPSPFITGKLLTRHSTMKC